METTKSEFDETCHKFERAGQRELEFARQEEGWVDKLGRAHTAKVVLLSQLRNGSESLNVASPDTDELLRTITARKQALDDQQAMIGTLTAALDRARVDKKQTAEQVAEHYRSLVKQAHAMLKERFGRTPSRFAFWSEASEAAMAWRVITLNQLLYLVQTRVPGSFATLRYLLSGDSFRIRVVRGFFVRVDGAMKEIRPTAYHVPKDIPARDAFEAVITGRAEFAAGA